MKKYLITALIATVIASLIMIPIGIHLQRRADSYLKREGGSLDVKGTRQNIPIQLTVSGLWALSPHCEFDGEWNHITYKWWPNMKVDLFLASSQGSGAQFTKSIQVSSGYNKPISINE